MMIWGHGDNPRKTRMQQVEDNSTSHKTRLQVMFVRSESIVGIMKFGLPALSDRSVALYGHQSVFNSI